MTTLPPALRRRFFKLTALNILANLTVPLAGLVDTGMLGLLRLNRDILIRGTLRALSLAAFTN